MGKFIDLTGRRFGRLVVLERAQNRGHHTCWLCQCDCGNKKTVYGTALGAGLTKSCGCFNVEKMLSRTVTHGMTRSRLYREYSSMKRRCTNPNVRDYCRYGGRGISVCSEWLNSFEAFRDWAISAGYQEDLSLDRVDVNGNYCPENCRWITMDAQANNKRTSRFITYNGKTLTVAQWSKATGIKKETLYGRLNRGWPAEKILTKDPHR